MSIRCPLQIGVAVIAFEASSTIVAVIDAVEAAMRDSAASLLVADDHSSDDTHELAMDWAAEAVRSSPVEVVRNGRNLGYGANQKVALRWAMERGLDVVVLLHGDGQHLPGEIPTLVEPIAADRSDAVFGSRMMEKGAARRGSMPLNRYWANRALSGIQNRFAGTHFTEWHSGFRAYRVSTVRRVDLDALSDWFDFDCAMTLALLDSGARVTEVPCTTRYADEISRVQLVRYGVRVLYQAVWHGAGGGRPVPGEGAATRWPTAGTGPSRRCGADPTNPTTRAGNG